MKLHEKRLEKKLLGGLLAVSFVLTSSFIVASKGEAYYDYIYYGDRFAENLSGRTFNVGKYNNWDVVCPGVAYKGTSTYNRVNMTDGEVGAVVGGYSDRNTASHNEVSIQGGKVTGGSFSVYAYGGYTYMSLYGAFGGCATRGNANYNTVNVSGGTVNEAVGGSSYSYKTMYNNVNISGGTIEAACGGASRIKPTSYNKVMMTAGKADMVAGGYAYRSSASKNTFDMYGGTVGFATGGYAYMGAATGNTTNVYGGTVTGGNYSFYAFDNWMYGEYPGIYGGLSQTGVVSKNVLNVHNGTMNMADGAYSREGKASSNTLNIMGGTINQMAAGGESFNRLATYNTANVTGGNTSLVAGGLSSNNTASYNKANMSSGTVDNILGGVSINANAYKNKATIDGGIINGGAIKADGYIGYSLEGAYGGGSLFGNATQNSIIVNNGTLNGAFGGYSMNGAASKNTTTINGGTVTYAAGGFSEKGLANKNSMKIYAGQTTLAIGGASTNGNATSNTLTINDGIIKRAMGGVSDNGTIEKNIVNLKNGNVEELFGGFSKEAALVSANTVNVTGGVSSVDIFGGASLKGNALNNKVIVKEGKLADVTGGSANEGLAKDNKVSVIAGTMKDVYGGASLSGEVNNNRIVISGGTMENAYASWASAGITYNNMVTVKNGTINKAVYGGYGEDGSRIIGNRVVILGGQAVKAIGGQGAAASYNSVKVTGGSVQDVYGAIATGSAIKNTVYVTKGNFGNIYGGYGKGYATVQNNEVIVAGRAIVNGNIYGGYSENGVCEDNNIYLGGSAVINGTVYGNNGNTIYLGKKVNVSGANIVGGTNTWTNEAAKIKAINKYTSAPTAVPYSTLSISDSWTGSVKSLSNIDAISYGELSWNNQGVVLSISEDKENLAEIKLNVNNLSIAGGSAIAEGQSMQLVDAENQGTDTKELQVKAGVSRIVGLSLDGNNASVTGVSFNKQVKAIGESRTAATAFVNQGTELIDDGLMQLKNSAEAIDVFAALEGNNSHYNTGSHVTVHGFNGIVGVAKNNKNNLSYGAFFENGKGNYNTYANGCKGDGSSVYNGGGIVLQKKLTKGFYAEAAVRAGMLKNNLRHGLIDHKGVKQGYSLESAYYGAQIGLGKLLQTSENTSVDLYGKYLYTYNEGKNFNIDGDKFRFDSWESKRLRAGFRVNRIMSKGMKLYYGMSYEYELDGKAANRVAGYDLHSPSLRGGVVYGELGADYKANNKWNIGANVKAFGGQRKGLGGNLQVNYSF